METRFGDQAPGRFFGGGVPDYLSREKEGKRSLEWDLNDWKWDGGLFIASPLKSVPGDYRRELVVEENQVTEVVSNSSSSCSEENEKEKRELEKRRRVVVSEDSELNGEVGNLTLKLGEHVYPITESEGGNWDERNGKKSKLMGAGSNRAVCQVQNCGADLSTSKDYHRRHKVCEMHSKASKALVGNVMQRFCQQCSRFHLLQEFDEGKRSCRRRLAGHNKRRRKTNPETAVNGNSLNDDRASSYLLISLLKILSNMHSNNSDQTKNQDLLSHLLKNLASNDGTVNGRNVSGLLQEYQDMPNIETSTEAFSEVPPGLPSNGHGSSRNLGSTSKTNGVVDDTQGPLRKNDQLVTVAATNGLHDKIYLASSSVGSKQTLTYPDSTTPFPAKENLPAKVVVQASSFGGTKINNFDLNSAYNDMQDSSEGVEGSQPPASFGTCSPEFPPWMRKEPLQSSPPHTSGNSDSTSTISPSSSSGSGQSRTDRIVFKLFGKDPSDFPHMVRAQILDWLSHSPTDIESYIRPGCIVLTIYLRLAESTWQELSGDLTSSLSRLLNVSDDPFWKTGWAYIEVQDRIAFIYSGQVVLDIPLPLGSHNQSSIITVTPIAVSVSERAQFTVKGFNMSRPTTRLLCALEGKYLLEEATHDILENDTSSEEDELQCFTFPCSIPDTSGRGFIEVEDHGLSSGFFPFIVAEQDVCSEIRMLESIIEVAEFSDDIDGATGKLEARNQALDFIHEMGWLFHRSRLRSRVGHIDPTTDVFPFPRFKWLIDFSMDHDWCAVVNKLLEILFEGTVGSGDHSSIELALSELCLLHRAVRRSSRQMVELLLRYAPNKALMEAETETRQQVGGSSIYFFRPDAVGPAGLTPLHIAASRDGSENLVDALTNDPGLVGVEAWKNIRDNTGSTPEDYARLRGHYSYIHLVHKKIKKTETEHVILDIPADLSDYSSNHKSGKSHSSKVSSLQIEKINPRPTKIQSSCKACDHQLAYGSRRSMVYRPAMLSLLAIAAVCVCVALLFKSSPEVLFVYPFRWEFLDYGSI